MTEPVPLHDDDIPVDTDLAQQLVDEQFPDWAHLPLRRIASSGTVNAIFRLGDDLVVRLPRAESYVWDLDTLGASEAWLRWAAPRLPLAIPEPVAIGEASDRYPWSWPIHRWIEGTALDTVDLTSSTRAAERLAEFVVALRQLPDLDGPRSVKAIGRKDWDPIFRRVLGDLDGVVDTRRALRAWELTMQAESWTGRFGWVHADLLPGNLLARDGDLVAVVDFECLGTGDPAIDIAAAWANFDQPTRQVFREAAGVDEHSWLRAANYALRAVMGIRYYEHTNPRFSQLALRAVTEVTDELTKTRTGSRGSVGTGRGQ